MPQKARPENAASTSVATSTSVRRIRHNSGDGRSQTSSMLETIRRARRA